MLVETMHTVAPGADVLYVGSTSSMDLPLATLEAVDGEYGDIVMNGWYQAGENASDADVQLITNIATQAAATGISLLFAAGDLGDNTTAGSGRPSPVYPAHNPMVTAVGGTSLILGSGGHYLRELGWAKTHAELKDGEWLDGTKATFRGTGGGVSKRFAQPAYQKGVAPPSFSSGRAVPDLAALGDAETGMSIGYTQTFPDGSHRYSERRVASTTSATALFAGLLALANEQRKHNLGFVNPLLYALAKRSPSAFRDIVPTFRYGSGVRVDYVSGDHGRTTTVLKTFEAFTSNEPARGYDTNSGLGSPSPAFLRLLSAAP
jgi:subtilase family serine protease